MAWLVALCYFNLAFPEDRALLRSNPSAAEGGTLDGRDPAGLGLLFDSIHGRTWTGSGVASGLAEALGGSSLATGSCRSGRLIQTSASGRATMGRPRTNRSGCLANDASMAT